MTDTPPDPVAFPDLDDAQLSIVAELGERRRAEAGEILFSPSDDHYDWVVVLSGSVEILGNDADGATVITRHGARRFLGEVSLAHPPTPVPDRRDVAEAGRGRRRPGRRLPRPTSWPTPGSSDTVLEAFLARRAVLLLAAAADTLQIVGLGRSPPPSMALREYAARNRLPHRWIDADDDPERRRHCSSDRLGVDRGRPARSPSSPRATS